eukprot:TRINITY_DN594_c8_g1_i1.p1 TRINITY_DN594_c8_g1~~TRINITY_DN594_c8_g1_i1.p1  ORF type:complete len:340 (+),score=105.83 TRINITY_DN594_c8_g1_i1:88-1107(+)
MASRPVDAEALMGSTMWEDDDVVGAPAATAAQQQRGSDDSAEFALRLQLEEYAELERSLPEDLRPSADLDAQTRLVLLREIAQHRYVAQQEEAMRRLMHFDEDDESWALAGQLQREEMMMQDAEAEDEAMPMEADEGAPAARTLVGSHSRADFLQMMHARLQAMGMTLHEGIDVDRMSYEELLQLGDQIGRVSTGLDAEQIKKHTSEMTFSESVIAANGVQGGCDCSICLTEFESGDAVRLLQCRHLFHKDCVDQWLQDNRKCPVCKQEADEIPRPAPAPAAVSPPRAAAPPSPPPSPPAEPAAPMRHAPPPAPMQTAPPQRRGHKASSRQQHVPMLLR